MYQIYVTDAYYIFNEGSFDWATDVDKSIPEFTSKKVEEHETVELAIESMSNWGSRWAMYPSVVIENDEGEEVYSSYSSLIRCDHCKHEEWEQIEHDLRKLKTKDGQVMFPDIH